MPIQSAVVKTGATALTVTGGTDKTFGPDGQTVVNGVHIADVAQADFRIRANATFKNKVPVRGSDGKYSKDRKSATYVQPKLLADGSTSYNLIRIEREVHPETTAAEAFDLLMIAGQLVSDTDFTTFWTVGNLS